ncbi:TSUP family transporter [Ornithinimicrobium sp. Arc0846-15]|nr:TSUP family transporter [Ornithinimicrobium laminariae]
MPWETLLLLLVAGVAAGLVGYLMGLASLISFPALLAAGLPPLAANVTNTVSLMGIGIGATAKSARPLFGSSHVGLKRQIPIALAGGTIGAVLLIAGGEEVFATIVPLLVLMGSIAVLISPRLRKMSGDTDRPRLYLVGMFIVCIYGGYFGAGAGVLFLAMILIGTATPMAFALMQRAFLLGIANLVSATIFVFIAPVAWAAALAMGTGCLIGGVLGPVVADYIPERGLRWAVAIAGVGLAIWLGFA